MTADNRSYKKSSFGPAFFFLGKRRREALADYYEFCRRMDDIADEPDVKDPEAQLDAWAAEMNRVYEADPQTDLGKRLAKDVKTFGLSKDRFLLLIEGMRADLQGRSYQTPGELEWYLYRVAVIVGCATLDILGVKGRAADELSFQLGSAVQLTNIIRDVHDDAEIGRVYLPLEMLETFGLTRADVLEGKKPRELAALLAALDTKARECYARAFAQMKKFPRLKMLPCRVMGYVYFKNLAKIRATDFKFIRPVKLTKGEKLTSIGYALFKTIF